MVPGPIRGGLRRIRESAPALLEPIDYLGRAINGKAGQPPRRLRNIGGSLRDFETSSAEVLAYTRAVCGLRPQDRILDIGCGAGGTALQLVGFLDGAGRYLGVDIHPPSIAWARRHLAPRDQRLDFQLLDVRNPAYNPGGKADAATYVFDLPENSFDLVIAKSLFTHLRPAEVDNYIKEIARVLAPGGHCTLTFFLLTPFRDDLVQRGRSPVFAHGKGVWRYADENLPEAACAYSEQHIRETLGRHGLGVEKIIYGHQDVLVAGSASEKH